MGAIAADQRTMATARSAAADACASSDYGSGMEPTEDQGAFQPRTSPMTVDDPVVQWLLLGDTGDPLAGSARSARRRGDCGGDRASPGGARGLGCSAAGAAGSRWDVGERSLLSGVPPRSQRTLHEATSPPGEPPPAWPSPAAEPGEAPTDGSGAELDEPWTATYPVLLDLCHLGTPPDSPVMREPAPPGGAQLPLGVRRSAVLRRRGGLLHQRRHDLVGPTWAST